MILVLLSRFSEFGQSNFGYTICKTLTEHGHHLYVTTTSIGEELQTETNNAAKLTFESKGSITLFEPDHGSNEEPYTKWINISHEKYFSFLSELDDVDIIVGVQSETEVSAQKLKETLNCDVVIVRHIEGKLTLDGPTYLGSTVKSPDVEILFDLNPKIHTSCQLFVQKIDTTLRYKRRKVKELTLNIAGKQLVLLISYFVEWYQSFPKDF